MSAYVINQLPYCLFQEDFDKWKHIDRRLTYGQLSYKTQMFRGLFVIFDLSNRVLSSILINTWPNPLLEPTNHLPYVLITG